MGAVACIMNLGIPELIKVLAHVINVMNPGIPRHPFI